MDATQISPLFQEALNFAKQQGAQRAMVTYGGLGSVYGMDGETLWTTGEISHSLLQALLQEAEPIVLLDAAEDWGQTSAVLASLRSVLFIPLPDGQGQMAGLIYADNQQQAGTFGQEHLDAAAAFVEENLAPRLIELASDPTPQDWDSLTATTWV